MARGMWKGNISFGLVTIPVTVVSGENRKESLDFDLLDRRDHAHVGYQKINKKTGKPISSEDIVKGLKLESGKYAIFEQDELKELKIKGTNSIDIQEFVDRTEIDPIYFKKFYYLEPSKGGNKTYVLLRETLKETDKFAVGLIALHGRQQLVLIGATDEALILHGIHFADEIKTTKELELPAPGIKAVKISEKEIAMAKRLVDELSGKWKPKDFEDTYVHDITQAIKDKGRKKVEADEESVQTDVETSKAASKVLDLMPLLEKSLKTKSKGKTSRHRASA
jgi:DNA end-binding protein Ku